MVVSACALKSDVHSFSACLLGTCFMLCAGPGTADKMTSKTDKGPALRDRLCPSGSLLCSILRTLLGVTGMCTTGKPLLETCFPLWQEMEQRPSCWGTPGLSVPTLFFHFHHFFSFNCFLSEVFAFKLEFAPLLTIPPAWIPLQRQPELLACWCLDGLHGNSQDLNGVNFTFFLLQILFTE